MTSFFRFGIILTLISKIGAIRCSKTVQQNLFTCNIIYVLEL